MWRKEESEKSSLKFNIQKTKIMASSPITSWQIDGENVEVTGFIFLGFKMLQIAITVMKLKDASWKISYDKLSQQSSV